VRAIAEWLVARPLNATLGLAATLALPWLGFLSGVVLVLLVLKQGPQLAVLEAVAAGVLLAVVSAVLQAPVAGVIQGAVSIWLPAMLFGVALALTRSLTLTLQLSVVVAIVVLAGFFLMPGEPADFWEEALLALAAVWRELGLAEQADVLTAEVRPIAEQMTMIAAIIGWSVHAATLVLGYKLFRTLPGEGPRYGRFRDLDLGRVIALLMAIASVAAYLSNAAWLQNIAFVLFAVFWMHGLAIVHWLYGEGQLPLLAVVAIYVLAPFLNVFMLVGLAITGYVDAWFGFRKHPRAA
jgi:hypothetical protein